MYFSVFFFFNFFPSHYSSKAPCEETCHICLLFLLIVRLKTRLKTYFLKCYVMTKALNHRSYFPILETQDEIIAERNCYWMYEGWIQQGSKQPTIFITSPAHWWNRISASVVTSYLCPCSTSKNTIVHTGQRILRTLIRVSTASRALLEKGSFSDMSVHTQKGNFTSTSIVTRGLAVRTRARNVSVSTHR